LGRQNSEIAKRIRIADVAAAAAVSHTTASMILSGRSDAFPESTRERVQNAAQQLGYRANRMARNLVRQRTEMIGVVLEFIENPFFSSLASYLNRRVLAEKYQLLFEMTVLSAPESIQKQAIDSLLDWRVDGLLHWWNESYHFPVEEWAGGTPVVFFGSSAPNETVDAVYLNDYAGARLAVEYLVRLGHRQIGHLSRSARIQGARARAVQDVLAEQGLAPALIRECRSEAAEEAYVLAYEMAQSPDRPTALFCHNDVMAFGAFRGLRDAGLRVPEDISLIGYDDTWAARYIEPALTTIVFPYQQIVDTALNFLLTRIAGQAQGPQRKVVAATLVERESTAPPPGA
jgi:DNA-binding LacI/PurR family transcriptional regulator